MKYFNKYYIHIYIFRLLQNNSFTHKTHIRTSIEIIFLRPLLYKIAYIYIYIIIYIYDHIPRLSFSLLIIELFSRLSRLTTFKRTETRIYRTESTVNFHGTAE